MSGGSFIDLFVSLLMFSFEYLVHMLGLSVAKLDGARSIRLRDMAADLSPSQPVPIHTKS